MVDGKVLFIYGNTMTTNVAIDGYLIYYEV